MNQVNLYTISSRLAPSKGKGKFIYILETETGKGIATLTRTESFEDKTANEAYIFGLTEALKHINRSCALNIYIESDFIYAALTRWIPSWIESGWKSSRGTVANAEMWQTLLEQLNKHEVHFFEPRTAHEYRNWLKTEVSK